MKKIILILASFILILDSVFSQEIEWQNTIGGSDNDELTSIQQTFDGGYIIGGFSKSEISGDKTEANVDTNGYYVDYWIVKVDSAGIIQWQNTIGGSMSDNLFSVRQTSDGGYILGGSSTSHISGDKTEDRIGNWEDYWLVKIDVSGNIQWQNTIGGTGGDLLRVVQQTNDDGYILGGYSESNISGDKTENNWDTTLLTSDYWIVKTDSLGNIEWQNTIGGNSGDALFTLDQTTDGGYILGGNSNSDISGDKSENHFGLSSTVDYWIVKIDSSGTIQWENTIGGNTQDYLRSVQETNDSGFILGGYSNSGISGDKTQASIALDYWIVKTDALGNIQWQKTMGGNVHEYLNSIQQANDGGYILGGWSDSDISCDKTEHRIGSGDCWIVKTDSAGEILWQNTIGGTSGDGVYSIQQTADEGYIVAGDSWSNISGDKSENCIGNSDYWIVKLTNKYNSITGKLFYDPNSNLVQDAGEPAINNKMVTESNSNRFGFSDQDGFFNITVLDSGNFEASPADGVNYYSPVPATQTGYFSGINQTDSLNDFAFQPAGVFNDLCVTITPMGNFRAGFNASYMIAYENVGTTTLNGTVIFFPDNDVTFVSSNVIPTSVTTDSVVWNVGTLTPFQTGSILVTVNVPIGTTIGSLINSSVRIEPLAGDNYPGCNYAYWEVYTTGSYDPNAILVDRDTVLTTELPQLPYLDYIIYFQNTGNDTAFNIKILNPIDTFKLKINTFEFVASSHPVNIKWIPWEKNMEFKFTNIHLPDSVVNEPASHGYVRYRIKPRLSLSAGKKIRNTAYIYFDFNDPVQTDTAMTEIVLPTGLTPGPSPKERGVALAPNPVTDELTISFPPPLRGGLVGLHIFDLYGREVLKMEAGGQKSEVRIDVSGFSQGIYIIEMRAGEKLLRGKFVKQ